MLSLRNRFGIPGVISVLALVFALVAGGAYAASGDNAGTSAKKNNRAKKKKGNAGLSGKQKRQVRNIAKQEAKKFQGTGPAGPQGLPGVAGPKGPKGDKGSTGSSGSNGKEGPAGKSVEVSASFCGGLEGAEVKQEGAGSGVEVCNGEDGSPWTAGGTLPEGATENGVYGVGLGVFGQTGFLAESAKAPTAIGFPVPLASSPDFVFVAGNLDKEGGEYLGEATGSGDLASGSDTITNFASAEKFTAGSSISGSGIPPETFIEEVISATELKLTAEATATATGVDLTMGEGCPGVSGGLAEADSGKLCVYGWASKFGVLPFRSSEVTSATVTAEVGSTVSPAGTLLLIACPAGESTGCHAKGVWAVTG